MTVECSIAEGVATIALNRPEVRNALNLEMCNALLDVSKKIVQEQVRLVFIRGNGPAFCGGADLNERKGKSEEWIRSRRMRAFAAYGAIEALPMPCVALVHGAVIGSGVEIAAACDFIVATPDATFRTPLRRLTPASPACRMSRATRLRPTCVPSALNSACTRGTP